MGLGSLNLTHFSTRHVLLSEVHIGIDRARLICLYVPKILTNVWLVISEFG